MGAVSASKAYPTLSKRRPDEGRIQPVEVTLDRPADKYEYNSAARLTLTPQAGPPLFVYVYAESGPNTFVRLFPSQPKGSVVKQDYYTLSHQDARNVDFVGGAEMRINCEPMKFHLNRPKY